MDLTRYPVWLIKSRPNEDKKYVGFMLPLPMFEEMERLAYQEQLTISDVVRLALWDFLRKNKREDIKEN